MGRRGLDRADGMKEAYNCQQVSAGMQWNHAGAASRTTQTHTTAAIPAILPAKQKL